MEHLGLHAAAHVFFENKLDDLTSEFNGKIKKVQAFVQKELRKLHDIHMGEVKKLKQELRVLKDEVVELRRLEDDITHTGMSQIRRLSKEVKEEVHDIKRIKGEVTHMKEEITDIKHHEEDITHVGMHQMTKMNKEMKTEVKQLKSQIKSLKREVMEAKEGSSKQLESDDTVNTLKLTPQEIDELLAVRESVHSALEKSMKSTTACPDSETERSSTVEEGKNSLNLWLTNPTSPSATSDDAIQLSRTVILYVKAGRCQGSPVSSHPSLQWSSHEEDICLSSAPVTRNSSFDAAGARARIAQSKAGSQETEEDEAHAHHHHAAHPHQEGHLVSHMPHSVGNFHHLHLTSALHEVRGDSISLTPVLSEDEEAVEEKVESNEDSGLRMRIDKDPGDVSAATKCGQVTEETSDGESLTTAGCVGEEHLEGCGDVKDNNNEYQGQQEKNVAVKHRGSI